MFELPEHHPIGVTANGEGPVAGDDPDYVETVCWCGDVDCQKWKDADV